MLRYLLIRLARALGSLLLVVIIVFCLLRLMPVEGYFQNYDDMTPTQIENAKQKLGLADPLPTQLAHFFTQLAHGDLGVSLRYRVNYPILKIIAQKAPFSIRFGLLAIAISLPLGLALGTIMARFKGQWVDKFGILYIVLLQAIPAAVYYLFIQLYGSQALGLSVLYDPDRLQSMILPLISLCLPSVAGYAMWMRRYALDEGTKDYVQLARAKGVPGAAIWFSHVLRNAIVPIVNFIPGSILFTLTGSIYVESLYSIPGMGGLLVDVIKRQDNNMVQALVMLYAAMSICSLLLGDLLMALADPRISLGRKEAVR